MASDSRPTRHGGIKRIGLVSLPACSELDNFAACCRFYGELVGLRVAYKDDARNWIAFQTEGALLASRLATTERATNSPAVDDPVPHLPGSAGSSIVLAVEDLASLRAKLEQEGFQLEPYVASFDVQDPCGTTIRFLQL